MIRDPIRRQFSLLSERSGLHQAYDVVLRHTLQRRVSKSMEHGWHEVAHVRCECGEHAGKIVGQSAPLKQVVRAVEQVAKADLTVLVLGETGTGKELVARALH